MELVATLLIVLGAMATVLWPLVATRVRSTSGSSPKQDQLETLLAQRDSAYDAVRELDFEHRLGNLSEEDYLELRERYREQAATTLQRLDRLTQTDPAARSDESMPAAAKITARPVERRRAKPRPSAALFCGQCGERVEESAVYCRWCGQKLEADLET